MTLVALSVKMHLKPLNAEFYPIWHLLALLGAHHILHVSRIRVKKGVTVVLEERESVVVFNK